MLLALLFLLLCIVNPILGEELVCGDPPTTPNFSGGSVIICRVQKVSGSKTTKKMFGGSKAAKRTLELGFRCETGKEGKGLKMLYPKNGEKLDESDVETQLVDVKGIAPCRGERNLKKTDRVCLATSIHSSIAGVPDVAKIFEAKFDLLFLAKKAGDKKSASNKDQVHHRVKVRKSLVVIPFFPSLYPPFLSPVSNRRSSFTPSLPPSLQTLPSSCSTESRAFINLSGME